MIPIFDSNILIDSGKGYPQAQAEIRKYSRIAISIITWIEVMAGNAVEYDKGITESFLSTFDIIHIDMALARKASILRRERRLKLPDAIILATAQIRGTLLVTRNSKDFPHHDPAIRIPYAL